MIHFKSPPFFSIKHDWRESIPVLALSVATLLLLSCSLSVSAKVTAENDSDGDGLSDQYETRIGTEAFLADTDGDGINDKIEIGDNLKKPLDSDSDGVINALDFDDDDDGLPTILENSLDTDKDGLANYIDKDSDNDGISDGIEAGMLGKDENFDMIDDAFDALQTGAVDKNGDGINDLLKLPDSNHNGVPDYLDKKSIKTVAIASEKVVKEKTAKEKIVTEIIKQELAAVKDKTPKDLEKIVEIKQTVITPETVKEKEKVKTVTIKIPKKRIVLNQYTDTDNDGLLDAHEIILGTNPHKRDSDGDKVSDAIEIGLDINSPQDTDDDGVIDALDNDDDNDGVLTKNEDVNNDSSPINDDTDGDGIPNFLDNDDDGDNRLTVVEGSKIDSDSDGILDYLDKNDGVKNKPVAVVKKEIIPDTPELVVIDEEKPAQTVQPELTKVSSVLSTELNTEPNTELSTELSTQKNNKNNLETALEAKPEEERKTLVESMIPESIQTEAGHVTKAENELPNVVAIKKTSKETKKEAVGIISWLTSLLPD